MQELAYVSFTVLKMGLFSNANKPYWVAVKPREKAMWVVKWVRV